MGVFENPDFQAGTIGVMDAIVKQPGVKSIIGGGDSAAAAINLGRADKFSWISTGGGASMELLEGKVLPGLAALTEKRFYKQIKEERDESSSFLLLKIKTLPLNYYS
ncbi:phosphoglycerate kinase [Streptococcus pneumoniae]|nr:phosphoglycerate kinase [Streptococcus pneumoniae]